MSKSTAVTRLVPGGATSNAQVPVVYSEAVKALQACQTIDESKLWADKADALAAWARIYKHDEAGTEAKRLKLHAYRRMGQLAEQIRPTRRGGPVRGAHSLLLEHGLTNEQAKSSMSLCRASSKQFRASLTNPRSVTGTAQQLMGNGRISVRLSDANKWLCSRYGSLLAPRGVNLTLVRTGFRRHLPREVAAGIAPGEVKKVRELVIEIIEWLDEFEQALPKSK